MKPMLGVVISLSLEAGFIAGWKGWHRQDDRKIKKIRLDSGLDLFYICSGVGAENAKTAAHYLISRGATALVVLGVSGGVDPGLNSGDLLIPNTLLRVDGPSHGIIDEPIAGRFSNHLIQMGAPIHRGSLFSHTAPLLTVEEKAAFFSRYGVKAVDMESAFVSQAADDAHLPFFVLRVICDTADTRIPSQISQSVSPKGSLHWGGLSSAVWGNPALIVQLIRLGYLFCRSLFILNRAWQCLLNQPLLFEPK